MTPPASLMVRLAAGAPNDALLKLTADLAARLGVARVIGISARQPIQIYGSPEMYVPPELVTWDREQIDRELKATEKDFRSALEGKVAAVEWRSTVVTYGTIADYIAEQMRAADLLVTATHEGGALLDGSRYVNVADVVLRAGRPVLVAASTQDRLDLRTVVVGWKDTREARRAVQDAVPLLRLAERVIVVEIVATDDLADARTRTQDVAGWLTSHGIAASARAVAATTGEATQLRNIASDLELDAGLLVGGAYGHTRLREWVLGGVTRDFLLQPSRCSFVSH
ncbi:MAG: universal stress protein [Reyranella sp.]|uniref:universal stress protein n=1 Tax=Reyranella sp. TaxID=1929291 RepID=UPI003D10DB82